MIRTNSAYHVQQAIERVRAEYLEMPGMQLTLDQVQRLFGVERTLCESVLESLVGSNFLCQTSSGRYARATEGEVPRARPAKSQLGAGHSAVRLSGRR